VAIVLVLWGGYKWMVSRGDENQITEAKHIITSGIIGLTIIFSSYAITLFILRSLVNVSR
jgi:TRAP-type C4-dicarboxylate transport system permease small subunit